MQKIDGAKLRSARGKMTQKALAEGICSTSHISQIENSKTQPTEQVAIALAERLGVDLDELFVDDPECSPGGNEQPSTLKLPATTEAFEAPVQEQASSAPAPNKRPTYLSRTESNHWLFINGFIHKIGHIIEEMSAHNAADPEVLALLTQGQELVAKGMAARLKNVDPKALQKIHRESFLLDIALCHRSDAERLYKQFYEEDRKLRQKAVEEHGGDPVASMAEHLLIYACMKCDGSPRCSKAGCTIYEAFAALDIPEWDMAHPKCKYAGAGAVEVAV